MLCGWVNTGPSGRRIVSVLCSSVLCIVVTLLVQMPNMTTTEQLALLVLGKDASKDAYPPPLGVLVV